MNLTRLKPSTFALLLGAGLVACSEKAGTSQSSDCGVSAPVEVERLQGDFIVTVLGSGTPVASATQAASSILVQAGPKAMIFDCGRGCTTRLAQLDPQLVGAVEYLFITHFHSDHIISVDDLWLNGWVNGRNKPLRVWGPQGAGELMRNLKHAYAFDIEIRHHEGLPATEDGIAEAFVDLQKGGVILDEDGVKVTAFEVDHGAVEPAFGYRVDYDGRSVVISGDTRPTENMYTYGDGVDVLIHEVMSPALIDYLKSNFSASQAQDVIDYHTTASQAAKIFNETKPKLAVYYHTRNDGPFASSLIDETRTIYDGPLKIGEDLLQISIGDDITTRSLMSHR